MQPVGTIPYCRWLSLVLCIAALSSVSCIRTVGAAQWYKGSIHEHTAWSDGEELPELVAYWYKNNGYNFTAMTDHNQSMQGTLWRTIGSSLAPVASVTRAEQLFGPNWVVQNGGQVKLKTCNEIKAKLDQAGQFLVIQGEEIDTDVGNKTVHINALNVGQTIAPQAGTTVLNALNKNLASVAAQATQLQRPILAQVNHPTYRNYDVTPQDMAAAAGGALRLFEVSNCWSDRARFFGDATHPGSEKSWDIANTIRLGQMDALPLYGTASDDAHHYETPFSSIRANPGRGWIMVHADSLGTNAILDAISQGDFYATTGVTLNSLAYNASTRTLNVEVAAVLGVNYTIDFIGTPVGTDPTPLPNGTYSSDIGKVYKSVAGTSASYTLTGNELYIRAVIRSDNPMANSAPDGLQMEWAWGQPVGSWMSIPEPRACVMLAWGAVTMLLLRSWWMILLAIKCRTAPGHSAPSISDGWRPR